MWEQIRSNRIRSAFVVTGMALLLGAVGASLGAMFGGVGGMAIGVGVALVLWLILWTTTVANGDDVFLRMSKAQQIESKDHPVLWNVVEEMSIAAALPKMPRVYVVEDPAPNAFATGRNPDKAAVAVTTGLLGMLDRDELQGVVAHEIGHIKNRDVALIVTAGVMVGAVALLGDVGRRALFYGGMSRSRSSNRNGGGGAIIAVVSILVLILAPIFAQLMYFALSRRREFLADASGARFSRYPEGLARALEKISGQRVPQRDQSRVTAPMYIVSPVHPGAMAARGQGSSMFSTHPSVEQRVRVLRSMAGGAGVADYLRAYSQVTGRQLLHSVPEDAGLAARAAAVGAAGFVDAPRARARAASDALLTSGGWQILDCGNCGARVKLPPPLAGVVRRCPRCEAPLGG
ncbi:MAG: M48 family metallopeptidase [Planctomycetota bacterium]|nr:M48 family metallopeptidase [Planctomycetota bacterium]